MQTNIGKKVYCIDQKTKKIFKATIVGDQISTQGYLLIALLKDKDNEKIFLENKLVYSKMVDAKEYLEAKSYSIDYAAKIMNDATKQIDRLRLDIIGEPDYAELASLIMGDLVVHGGDDNG